MVSRKTNIVHCLSEVAGQNSYFVQGLKNLGINADTVIACNHPFNYPYDLSLKIDKSKKILYPYYAVKLFGFFVVSLFKYDIYHFHYGRSILFNKELFIYDLLGKDYYYEFHGSDLRNMEKFCENSKLEFSDEFRYPEKLRKRNEYICRKAKGIILHDDELIPYLPNDHAPVYVLPLRMDVAQFNPSYPSVDTDKIVIVHAPSKRSLKGTKYVLDAFDELKKKYNNIELVLVEGKTQDEAKKIYSNADIIVDQLFIGTYGVFAIEGMALGKPVVTYITDEMKSKLPEDLPIVSANVDTIYDSLEELICNPKLRNELGRAGRKYVETYHDYNNISKSLLDVYQCNASPVSGREAFEKIKCISSKG